MKKILRSLRNKPDYIKKRYVMVLAVLATVCVVGAWVVVKHSVQQQDQNISAESPFKIFKDIFSATMTEISNTQSGTQSLSEIEQDFIENFESNGTSNISGTELNNDQEISDVTLTDQEYQEKNSEIILEQDFIGIPKSVVQ